MIAFGALEDAHVLNQTQNLQERKYHFLLYSSTQPESNSLCIHWHTHQHITGTFTFLNISAPLRASSRAMSCGVDTITAPVQDKRHMTRLNFELNMCHLLLGATAMRILLKSEVMCLENIIYIRWCVTNPPAMGMFWVIDSWTSPVPGGMSTTK